MSRICRIVLIGIMSISFILLGYLSLQNWIEKTFTRYLQASISEKSGNLYGVYFDQFNFNLLNRSISFSDVVLKVDSIMLGKMDTTEKKPEDLINLTIEEINIFNISVIPAILRQAIIIKKIELKQPVVSLFRNEAIPTLDSTEHKTSPQLAFKKLLEILPGTSKRLQISKLTLSEGSLNVFFQMESRMDTLSINHLNTHISSIVIDSTTLNDPNIFLPIENIQLEFHEFSYALPGELYELNIKKFVANSLNRHITIDSLSMVPQYDRKKFAQKVGFQQSINTSVIPSIHITELNFDSIFRQNVFLARKIECTNPALHSYKNKSLPFNRNRKIPFPQEALLNLNASFHIDTFLIHNGFIEYEEQVREENQAGKLNFTNVSAIATPISNRDSFIEKNTSIAVKASAYLMGESLINVVFDFPIQKDASTYSYQYEGHLDTFEMKEINPMISPLTYAYLESGIVDELSFTIHTNSYLSTGEMRFKYHDLKVKFEQEQQGFLQDIIPDIKSFIANSLVLKDSNPAKEGEPLRIGEIHYEIEQNRSIFGHMWYSLLSGFLSST